MCKSFFDTTAPSFTLASPCASWEFDGCANAIQQLDEAVVQVLNHAVLHQGDKVIVGHDHMNFPGEGCRE